MLVPLMSYTTAMVLFVTKFVFYQCSPPFNIVQEIGLYNPPKLKLLNDQVHLCPVQLVVVALANKSRWKVDLSNRGVSDRFLSYIRQSRSHNTYDFKHYLIPVLNLLD